MSDTIPASCCDLYERFLAAALSGLTASYGGEGGEREIVAEASRIAKIATREVVRVKSEELDYVE